MSNIVLAVANCSGVFPASQAALVKKVRDDPHQRKAPDNSGWEVLRDAHGFCTFDIQPQQQSEVMLDRCSPRPAQPSAVTL